MSQSDLPLHRGDRPGAFLHCLPGEVAQSVGIDVRGIGRCLVGWVQLWGVLPEQPARVVHGGRLQPGVGEGEVLVFTDGLLEKLDRPSGLREADEEAVEDDDDDEEEEEEDNEDNDC